MSQETATIGTFLMYKKSGEQDFKELVPIVDYPALGGEPEQIDVTDLSDTMQRFVLGVQKLKTFEFKAHYYLDTYKTIKELEKEQGLTIAVWLGGKDEGTGKLVPQGQDGKFQFGGTIAVKVEGGKVNEARTMTITVAPNTGITLVQ